jgi:hypothetical protein
MFVGGVGGRGVCYQLRSTIYSSDIKTYVYVAMGIRASSLINSYYGLFHGLLLHIINKTIEDNLQR